MQDTKAYGTPVPGWKPPAVPGAPLLRGHFMQLERLEPEAHAHALFAANAEDVGAWDYLPYGPFSSEAGFIRWLSEMAVQADPFFYAIRCLDSGQVGGVAAYLRITPQAGTIEIGHINLAARLQRTRAASEALMAMIGWAFEAGYRRVEWKCDALNMPSRHAAQRLGLSFEGVFGRPP
jgi:RimJ/RimL family protein N-acetyltransferase